MWKFILAIPLILHGLANLAGVFAPWSKSLLGFNDQPWILPGKARLRGALGQIWSVIWLGSSVCLVWAGIQLLQLQAGWSQWAILGSVLSLLSIVPWWKAVPPGARFGAIFDIIVITVLLTPLGGQINKLVGT